YRSGVWLRTAELRKRRERRANVIVIGRRDSKHAGRRDELRELPQEVRRMHEVLDDLIREYDVECADVRDVERVLRNEANVAALHARLCIREELLADVDRSHLYAGFSEQDRERGMSAADVVHRL